jgi:hypothetical protein
MTVGAPLLLRPGSAAAATLFVVAFYIGLVGAKIGMALLVARVRQVLLGAWYVWLNRLLAVALLALAVLLLRDGLALLTQG